MPIQQLNSAIQSVSSRACKLIIAPESMSASLNTGGNYRVINLSEYLARELLPLSPRERCRKTQGILASLAEAHQPVVFDHIELLFEPSLALQPLSLLKQLSRSAVIVVLWPGAITEHQLTYAQPMHPEYQHYDSDELQDVFIIPSDHD